MLHFPPLRDLLSRRARLESIVIKSISGHLTDRMKNLYSTVGEEEQREGIGLVLSRVKAEGLAIVKESASTNEAPSEQPAHEPEPQPPS